MKCATCGQSIADGSTFRYAQTPGGRLVFHPQCAPSNIKVKE